ncbi:MULTISPECIES: hypothetical protein [unclassified Pseudomonas]|uniref:hypothetical protein n=1 Tax=unclassified Pseudomonas TaxID=196821 RepID=UPI00200FAA34|nr:MULTISPECIES: hypothetical protein [unclassified Pseudomonas]
MNFDVRKSDKYAPEKDEKQRSAADAREREQVIAKLKECVANHKENEQILGWDYQIELVKNSSLDDVYAPGSALLSQLLQTVPLRSARVQEAIKPDAVICVTETGKLEMSSDIGWLDFVELGYFRSFRSGQDSLAILVEFAKEAGGYIWTDREIIVDQWLKFHGFDVPANIEELRNLTRCFEFNFPEVDEFGNYWSQLVTDDEALIVLSSEQWTAIRQCTLRKLPKDTRLLDHLLRESGSGSALHDNAAMLLKQVIEHASSQEWARDCLRQLDWLSEPVGQEALGQLLVTAMLLDINPFIGKALNRKAIGSYEMYSPGHLGRPSAIVLEGLRDHMVANKWVSHDAAPLAIHMCLAQIAPEFIVRQVPASLTIGSLEWVAYCRGVALVEAVSGGAARMMTYPQIMAYAELEPISKALADVHALALIDPIVDWALINGVITDAELRQSENATTQRAVVAYQSYVANFSQVSVAFSTPMPDRKAIAQAALETAVPDCDFLHKPVLEQRPGLYASPTKMSMVDLHMSGDLRRQEWDFRAVFPDSKAPDLLSQVDGSGRPALYDPKVESLYRRFPSLLLLTDNDVEFHRQLRGYLDELNTALTTTLKLALSRLSYFELQDVLRGELTFFTVRDSAVMTRTIPLGEGQAHKASWETQANKDAVTGRFGIVMCASHGGKLACYELFTLRGEIHRNDHLGKFIVQSGKLKAPARVDFKGDLNAEESPTPKERLPINRKCYIEGVANDFRVTSSEAIIEKLIVLPTPATPATPKKSEYQNFSDPRIEQISAMIVSRHPLMTFEQLKAAAIVPTTLEKERAQGDAVATYIVDLAVPFKKCVEDLSSGEFNRLVDGVYGCAMDVIALVGAVAGFAFSAASISAKATSMSVKLGYLAKLIIGTGVSIFNPLDDLPSILRGSGKLVYKGGMRLSQQAHEIIALAQSQMRHIGGARKTAVSAGRGALAGKGIWRPKATGVETMTVLAAREDFYWYALSRSGKPWGPKLNHFNFVAPFRGDRFHKTLPVSYTRAVIQRSLPRAKAKIENAIKALSDHDFSKEFESICKAFLGSNRSDATDRVLKYLKLIRTDFNGFSLSNMALDPHKDNGNIAAFDPGLYRQWVAASASERAKVMFMKIHTRNLNAHFIGHDYNHDVVADDLIHEMLHGAAQTEDVSYARDVAQPGSGDQVLNVTPLLNLANGKHPLVESDSATQYHPAGKAIENADSLALVVSLLDQYYTDNAEYQRNLYTLEQYLESTDTGAIVEPVLLTLNRPA